MGPLKMHSSLKPLFSYQVVAKRRKDRSDKARDRGPRKRTVGYVEEAGGTRLRVGGTRACGSRSQSGAFRRCSRPGVRNAG